MKKHTISKANNSNGKSIPPKNIIRCADFFAGIGGIRLGFEQAARQRVQTVFSNDFDAKCAETYSHNFNGGSSMTVGDITQISEKEIPDFDLMLAGFPCQAFSQAGFKRGFNDTRGTLFFDIARILEEKKPKAFLLENVATLQTHDKGTTFRRIIETLEVLGYDVHFKVLNSRDFGVPQNRSRIFIVGFKDPCDFQFPKPSGKNVAIKDILEKNPPEHTYLSQQYYEGAERHRKRHEAKGNGFGYLVLNPDGVANTLVLGGMGRERNLIKDKVIRRWRKDRDKLKYKNVKGLRKLSIRECARCQGFPEKFEFKVARVHAYKQLANSVSVPVIKRIALSMMKHM